jgi:hypothetical protein
MTPLRRNFIAASAFIAAICRLGRVAADNLKETGRPIVERVLAEYA